MLQSATDQKCVFVVPRLMAQVSVLVSKEYKTFDISMSEFVLHIQMFFVPMWSEA